MRETLIGALIMAIYVVAMAAYLLASWRAEVAQAQRDAEAHEPGQRDLA